MQFENTLAFAQQLDKEDKLAHFRNEFYMPKRWKNHDILMW
jgi:kynureninase